MKKLVSVLVGLLTLVPVMAANVDIYADNTDAHSEFHGTGDFSSTFTVVTSGKYLDSDVTASSSTGAGFNYYGWQNLAGYTNNRVETSAWTHGSTSNMNLRFDNSMYVVQLERHDTSNDFLSASGSGYNLGYQFGVSDGMIYSADMGIQLYDDNSLDGGSGTIDTNQWHPTATGSYGWGNPDGFESPNSPSYYTPTNTVSATGSGEYQQYGMGSSSLSYNGMNMPSGGSANTMVSFNGGFTFNPVVRAN